MQHVTTLKLMGNSSRRPDWAPLLSAKKRKLGLLAHAPLTLFQWFSCAIVWEKTCWHILGLLVPTEQCLVCIFADHVHPFMTAVSLSCNG